MAFSLVGEFTFGELASSAKMNAVRTNLNDLYDLYLMWKRVAAYAYVATADVEVSGSAVASWTSYPLNTEIYDTESIGTLSGSQVTLGAGTYRFRFVANLGIGDSTELYLGTRLYDHTNSATLAQGLPLATDGGVDIVHHVMLEALVVLADTAALSVQYVLYNGSSATLRRAIYNTNIDALGTGIPQGYLFVQKLV